MKEPSSWSSDLAHTPLEPARVMAKSRSMMWTTTSSPIKLRALRTQHTTISEACREWAKSNSSLATSASSLSLLSFLSQLLRGKLVSSSSHRHLLMEGGPGSSGAPCGVGLVSHRFISAWYVYLYLNSDRTEEHLCCSNWVELTLPSFSRQKWPAWLQSPAHNIVSHLTSKYFV